MKGKKILCSEFKAKHDKILKELTNRADNHEILFCANWWTGAGTSVPMFMSFDFEEAFNVAFENGITNPYPHFTRIEYFEVGALYPRLRRIGYIVPNRE